MATILVVDDRSINREFLFHLLGYSGYVVDVAADGNEALACVRHNRPDLIIADVVMPAMDGLELTSRLRADPSTADIPVVFYTATYRIEETRELARACGADLVLPKPSEPEVIIDAVARILDAPARRGRHADTSQIPIAAPIDGAGRLQRRLHRALDDGFHTAAMKLKSRRNLDSQRPLLADVHALSLRLAAVLELSLTLSVQRIRQDLLDLLCGAARDIVGARYVGVVLVDRAHGTGMTWSASGLDDTARADLGSIDPVRSFVGDVLLSEAPLRILIPGVDARPAGLPASHPPIKMMLAVPVRSSSGTLGGMYFADKTGGVAFDDDDELFATTLAALLGPNYDNLRLVDDAQRNTRELQIEVVERKRIAEGLRDSETRFRQMAENISDVFFLRDADGNRMLYISPAYEEIWGRSCEGIFANQESWAEAIHHEDRVAAYENYKHGLSAGKTEYEYRIVRPDGAIRWIETRSFPVRDEAGRIVRIAGIAKDITERKQTQEAIAAGADRYRLLFEASPLPMWVYDLGSLAFLAVNDAAVEHYGYSREQFLAMTIVDIRPEEDLPALRESLSNEGAGVNHSGVWRHRKRNGTVIEVEITSHVIDFSGRRSRLVLANDVTERFEQQRKIARMNRIRAVTGGISSAMLRLADRDELLSEACRVATTEGVFPIAWVSAIDPKTQKFRVVGFQGKDERAIEVIKLAAGETIPETDRPSYRAAMTGQPVVINDLSADPTVEPIRAQLLRRSYRSCAAFPLFVGARVVAVLVLLAEERGFFDAEEIALLDRLTADLSFALEHIEKSKRLDYLAYYDALTGLPNVRLFSDRLDQLVHVGRQDGGKVCVVVIDLERFTQTNDTLGRDVGDEVLRQVGTRLAQFLVEPYTLGRIGADTFAAASPRDLETIDTRLRDRMLDAFERPFNIGDREVRIAAQAGIALFPADGDDGNTVFKNAEAALKLAKSTGERYAYYSIETSGRIARRLALEEELRNAVDAKQFVLHYQPRVDMTSGEVVGAEALIRWEHPVRGLVAPSEFIALAEESGLIVPMGSWVIHAVCAQQAIWIAAGLDTVPIAVNVSSVQLQTSDMLQTVQDALAAHSLDASLIELELTESAVMSDSALATTTLVALRELGVGLALDDFGTGYSSLAHLKRFPFNSVKIDRAFVTDITRNTEDAAIATAIIAMAHRMELRVIAEGVETQGQFNYLRGQDCDEMQGFLYSPAITGELFESHLRDRKRFILPSPKPTDQRTLLIVDDEKGIRGALVRVLRRDGYRILIAASAHEALDLLALNHVQVIISDQRMPAVSGTEFLGVVRQLYPDTVRIILSGYTDLKAVTDSVNRGAVFKFLTKPWDDNLLREQVRDAFRRYRPETNTAVKLS
ncbi:MAG TPA: EAL domain-containing protein [Rudaea sp.]